MYRIVYIYTHAFVHMLYRKYHDYVTQTLCLLCYKFNYCSYLYRTFRNVTFV